MMRRFLIPPAVAFLVAVLTYLVIIVIAPDMYVEKALNILAAAFIGSACVTSLVLLRKQK
jgi:hypothetical protein